MHTTCGQAALTLVQCVVVLKCLFWLEMKIIGKDNIVITCTVFSVLLRTSMWSLPPTMTTLDPWVKCVLIPARALLDLALVSMDGPSLSRSLPTSIRPCSRFLLASWWTSEFLTCSKWLVLAGLLHQKNLDTYTIFWELHLECMWYFKARWMLIECNGCLNC